MHGLRLGDLTVDPAAGEMVGPGGREQLDPKVMEVLVALAQHAGEVVSRNDLLARVWPRVVVGEDVVSRCIYQLRRHLRQAGGADHYAALVETLPKRGYRLNCRPADLHRDGSGAARASLGEDTDAAPDATAPPTRTSARRRRALLPALRCCCSSPWPSRSRRGSASAGRSGRTRWPMRVTPASPISKA